MRTKFALTIGGIILILLAHTQAIDEYGLNATEAGLSRALVTFGVSRGLNGVISVVQGTEVAVEPVGIGMTFTPGQILDPVNDLVERFSTVVLVAGTAFGLQRVALEVTATHYYNWLVTGIVILALVFLWFGRRYPEWLKISIYKAATVLLIVRFAIPVLAIGGESFYQTFLASQFNESSAQLQQTSQELGDLQESATVTDQSTDEPGLLESARRLVKSATSSLDVKQHIEDFTAAAESISEHAVRLMVVFIFQTVVVPLLSLWLLLKGLRAVLLLKFRQPLPRLDH